MIFTYLKLNYLKISKIRNYSQSVMTSLNFTIKVQYIKNTCLVFQMSSKYRQLISILGGMVPQEAGYHSIV